ncbi:MAG: hypothetical protein ABI604_19750 [Nitrospirota bacterium]
MDLKDGKHPVGKSTGLYGGAHTARTFASVRSRIVRCPTDGAAARSYKTAVRSLLPKRREANTLSRKQCIDKGHGVLDRSGLPEDLGTAN